MSFKKNSLLEEAKLSALKRNGECLTGSWSPGSRAFFRFRCCRNHVWDADANKVIAGAWCPRCKRVERHLEELKVKIQEKGGRFIGPFINSRTLFPLECDKGHIWKTKSSAIMRGGWCKKCFFLGISNTIEHMQELAGKHGGQCLSSKYVDNKFKLKWMCKEGHIWLAKPNGISLGSWCPHCAGVAKKTLKDLQSAARKLGGECLSTKYENQKSYLKWRCKEGHEWEAVAANILGGRAWCPICAYAPMRFTLEDCKRIAERRGGECLAMVYRNSREKIPWKCKEGHTWMAMAKLVSSGAWCRKCAAAARRQPRLQIDNLHAYAKDRNGFLRSEKLAKTGEHLLWECYQGHLWKSTWTNIQSKGRWCPECRNNERRKGQASQIEFAAE